MALQYISDNSGNHTAVIIPIDEWNDIVATHEDLKDLEKPNKSASNKRKPSDFQGCVSKEVALKMLADIEQSRNEWERNI